MNWDAMGAIAEVLGAIGVIGTLMYLACGWRIPILNRMIEFS